MGGVRTQFFLRFDFFPGAGPFWPPLANYFRSFVPFHSDVVKPQQQMIDPKGKKKSSILWTPEAEKAFVKIREQVARCPLLHFMDEESPVDLYSDASD